MRYALATFCSLIIAATSALGQAGGGGGAGGGGAPGGGGARSSGGAPSTAPAPGSTVPSVSSNVPGVSPGRPAPGVANTPVDPQRNNVDTNPATRRLPGTTANSPNGSTQPGTPMPNGPVTTPSASGRPDPGGANSLPNNTRTAKEQAKEALADCMRLWDKGTHMSKAEWATTCRRIQGRLDNLKVDPAQSVSAPKRQRSARGQAE